MATSRSKANQAPTRPAEPPRSPRGKPAQAPAARAEPAPRPSPPDQSGVTAAAPGDRPEQESAAQQLFQLVQRVIRDSSVAGSAAAPAIMTALARASGVSTIERLPSGEAAGSATGTDPLVLIELVSIKVGPQQPAADDAGNEPIPPETRTALQLANDLLATPGAWLRTPNPQLGDRPPIDLIDTPEEIKVYNMLNAFQHGLY